MARTFSTFLMVMTVVILLAGCRTAQIYNVVEAPVTPVSGNEPTLDEVTQAIVAAGTQPRPAWAMQVVEPGYIRATLHIRSHTAIVDINYTTKDYSIMYNDSMNLKHDPDANTIHSNYNGWIQNLDNAIKVQLASL